MIRVSVKVLSDDSSFDAAVGAESIEQAVCLAGARYPGSEVRVLFPIDPEAFFSDEGHAPAAGQIRPEIPE